jgi:hypothetical protein
MAAFVLTRAASLRAADIINVPGYECLLRTFDW